MYKIITLLKKSTVRFENDTSIHFVSCNKLTGGIVHITLLRKLTAELKMHVKLRWNGKRKNSYFFGSEDYSQLN
jgi:hypothetical protein